MMDSIAKSEKKKRQINPDRIVLEVSSVEFVKRVAAQIDEAFAGVIRLTNKEISNFLLQSRTDLLSKEELQAVKDKYFDDVRAAQWAVRKLRSAKEGGEKLSLHEVLNMLQTPVVRKNSRAKTPKAKRSKETQVAGSDLLEEAFSGDVKALKEA